MNVLEALLNSLSFPITPKQAEVIVTSRDIDWEEEFSSAISKDRKFELCKADCIRLVITTPNVSEGGVSISFNDKKALIGYANSIYSKYGEPLILEQNPTVEFMHDW